MSIFQPQGDIHGRNCIGTPSVRGHHRPLDYDSGADFIERHVRVGDVGTDVGASGNTSNFRIFRVSSGTHKGEQ